MKKIFFTFLMSFCLVSVAFGQTLSDAQLIQIAVQERNSGTSETEIVKKLMEKGATLEQINRLRKQYASQVNRTAVSGTPDNASTNVDSRMRVNNEVNANNLEMNEEVLALDSVSQPVATDVRKVFGRDIFNNRSLTFEPQMNISTPQNYVLGPGDMLIIDIFGDTQKSEQLTVSPDGDVTVPEYGPIHVAGLSVAEAQQRVRSNLGSYYQSSDVKVSVGQTRTIIVNVMGEVRVPGTYTLSAFATVFHALYMAGGINDLGTLRNIQVFRQGRLITSVDVYEFILNGRLAGNVHLQDNDVIQVGPYEGIVEIEGSVKRPMAYELRKDESLATLLKYSGGFMNNAYQKSVRVVRNNGRMKSVFNVDEFEISEFKMADGDVVTVDQIIDRFENMVEVKGAVFRPGMYNFGKKVYSVRSLIEAADGVTEEAMTSRAVLRRMKPNRTQEVISVDLKGILDGTAADIALMNEDILFVPTLAEHQNLRTLTITGEVIFPGTYEYADNMTLEDLILQAGGLTDRASMTKIDVSRILRDAHATEAGMDLAQTFSFSLKDNFVVEGQQHFVLQPYDIVQVRRSPVFQDPIRVSVTGEIAFEGSYTMEKKNQRLSDVIKAAGGILPGGYVRGARLVRTMNADERARMLETIQVARQNADGNDSISLDKLEASTTYTVGIRLDEALAHPGSTQDVELMDGDQIIIPRINHTVRVSGEVYNPNTVAFEENKGYKYYVEQAGGFADRAKKRHAYIIYMNGTMAKAKKGKIEPGCEVIVPSKAPRNENALAQWMGIGSTMASLAALVASVVRLTK